MIWDSQPWKTDLAQRAAWLRKGMTSQAWADNHLLEAEQCIMIACYCVRKLIEAGKLTNTARDQELPVTSYPSRRKTVHSHNWHRLSELYDLERGQDATRGLRFVCNQLIHSFVFMLAFDEKDRLSGVFFCSDRERHEKVFRVSAEAFASALERIVADDVCHSRSIWNLERRDYEVDQYGEEGPPPGWLSGTVEEPAGDDKL